MIELVTRKRRVTGGFVMKNFITGLLIASMVMMPMTSFAVNPNILTIEDATTEVMENNTQLKIQDITIQMAEDQLEETEDQARKIRLDVIDKYGSQNSKADARIQKDVAVQRAEFNLETAKMGKDATQEKLKLSVKEVYYKLVELIKTIEQVEESYNNLLEQRDIVRTKLELGSATQLEYDKMEAKVTDLSSQLTYLKSTHEVTKMKFNNLLGREDLNVNFELDETIKAKQFDYNLTKITNEILENQQAIKNKEREFEIADRERDIYIRRAQTDYINRKVAVNNWKKAEIELNDARKQLKIDTYDKYFEIKKLNRELSVVELNRQTAEKDLEIAKIKLDTGMITQLQYADAENAYMKAKIDQIKKIQEYNMKIEQFEYFRTTGM